MSWLLDTDVLSQPAKRHGDARGIAWLRAERDNCYTSAVVIAQLAYWARGKQGRQREELQAWRPGLKVFNPFKELPPA